MCEPCGKSFVINPSEALSSLIIFLSLCESVSGLKTDTSHVNMSNMSTYYVSKQ